LGFPGALPVTNHQAVNLALRAALALNCYIHPVSQFARKNYFYPDLPKGYQITQYAYPLAEAGFLEITPPEQSPRRIRIQRLHLEEDAAKSAHNEPWCEPECSYLDFNRSGTPLIEIVSEPDLRTPDEAGLYLKKLKQLLEYIAVSDCNMEEGSLRCDANVSLRITAGAPPGTKTEIKNLNSFRHLKRALAAEIDRQATVLSAGKTIIPQTLMWDDHRHQLRPMRSKEDAPDYRYFPEPDLPPLQINEVWIAQVKTQLPELPQAKLARFQTDYGLRAYDAEILCTDPDIANYYEAVLLSFPADPHLAANWVLTHVLAHLKAIQCSIRHFSVTPARLAELLHLIHDQTITSTSAKVVFREMTQVTTSATQLVAEKNLHQITDENELLPIIEDIKANFPDHVERYRNGQETLLGFFVGQVMGRTKGRANPQVTHRLLHDQLKLN